MHPTTHENPTFIVDGIVHFGVANMPGGVPRTSTLAFTNATLPYVLQFANKGYRQALKESPALLKGLNIIGGKIMHKKVAEAFGLEYHAAESIADVSNNGCGNRSQSCAKIC
jgi:alanine dehydrogenase